MISTRLTRLFDINHPIISAPMALTSGGALAAAVTNAGGLGLLGGGYAGVLGGEPDLDEELRKAGNAEIGIGFITWALEQRPEMLDWALEKNPVSLFLSFGDPVPWATKARDAGIKVICQVQSLDGAKQAIEAGASVVVAQGGEAGGHGGKRGTMNFVAEVSDLLAQRSPETVLVAAGGIGDGRGLAAALSLGADGVVMGSRFWAADEALTPQCAIDRAQAASGDETIQTQTIDAIRGVPWPRDYFYRMLKNPLAEEWQGREEEAFQRFGELREEYDSARAAADFDRIAIVVGEVAGLISERKPARDIVLETVQQAENILKRNA
ncbi:MAG: nitronate monooxygenase, partial [Pseudomonadota bacterium]